jgi:hypothetical protein
MGMLGAEKGLHADGAVDNVHLSTIDHKGVIHHNLWVRIVQVPLTSVNGW